MRPGCYGNDQNQVIGPLLSRPEHMATYLARGGRAYAAEARAAATPRLDIHLMNRGDADL